METTASSITVVRQAAASLLAELGVSRWPIWAKGISEFKWTYDQRETCYLLEGEVTVTPAGGGAPVQFGRGDLVTFAAGLSCTWKITAPVRKHYRFE